MTSDKQMREEARNPRFEFAFEAHLDVGRPVFIPNVPSGGRRGFAPILGGDFEGPRLRGIIRPGGGDWPHVRMDGVGAPDSRCVLENEDGTLIYMQNRAYRHGPPEVIKRVEQRLEVDRDAYYFVTAPVFETSLGQHDWLTKHIFVALGDRTPEKLIFRVFLVS